jgi:hypothetical protein
LPRKWSGPPGADRARLSQINIGVVPEIFHQLLLRVKRRDEKEASKA